MKNIKNIYEGFQKFRNGLDEALYSDKGMKINFHYNLDESFYEQDLENLNNSIDVMINEINKLRTEIIK